MADRIREEVREVDVVARYGGEEFVVVLPETGERRRGAPRRAHLRADPVTAVAQRRPAISPSPSSIGVAVYPEHGDSPASLVRAADQALYAAKDDGRDRWRLAAALASSLSDAS